MGANKSGLNKEERERFLLDHGFLLDRNCGSSHSVWKHVELERLVQAKNKIDLAPANILANPSVQQTAPWVLSLSDDPASGYWARLEKHISWCAEQVEKIKSKEETERQARKISEEFRQNLADICQWKHAVKHWLKAGLDPAKAPKAPESYHQRPRLYV